MQNLCDSESSTIASRFDWGRPSNCRMTHGVVTSGRRRTARAVILMAGAMRSSDTLSKRTVRTARGVGDLKRAITTRGGVPQLGEEDARLTTASNHQFPSSSNTALLYRQNMATLRVTAKSGQALGPESRTTRGQLRPSSPLRASGRGLPLLPGASPSRRPRQTQSRLALGSAVTCSAAPHAASADDAPSVKQQRPALKVLVAGGGIGGLAAGLACKNQGLDVTIFEKVREYKPFGGPIQLQCNALGALESISPELLEKVQAAGTVTGDRINGLLDGEGGDWFYRFDTRKPCFKHGLPLTTVVSRFDLLDFLFNEVSDCVVNGCSEVVTAANSNVVSYENTANGVSVTLDDGTVHHGDVLIGADGIRSRVRSQMRKEKKGPPLKYAGYAVYTAVCDYTAEHTDTSRIGYQIFLGPKQYFVSSDVGNGQQQYYAFLDVPPGGEDKWAKCEEWDNYRDMLLDRFQGWCPAVLERLKCTRPEDVERRDVNDVAPDPRWVDGNVALLGDACHAVQPNLGQGGGQAIESSFVLAQELAEVGPEGVHGALDRYAQRRFLRTGAIHGLSRMASIMNTTYKRYLGSDPYDFYPEPVKQFWRQVEKLRIPHPGRVVGQVAMMGTMDGVLDYVGNGLSLPQPLGGAATGNGTHRAPRCNVPGISAPKRDLVNDDFRMRGVPGIAK